MRYVFFPFILIFLLITLSFCTGCRYNANPNQPLHDNQITHQSIETGKKTHAFTEQCDLIQEKNNLISTIDMIEFYE